MFIFISVGFVWNAREEIYAFPIVMKALAKYKNTFGSMDVPVLWTVPIDEDWSAELWTIPLGQICANMRFEILKLLFAIFRQKLRNILQASKNSFKF